MGMRIAVVGAGPSGSRAAAGLASLGHHVSLVDGSFDREKPCGGGIPAVGLSSLFEDRACAAPDGASGRKASRRRSGGEPIAASGDSGASDGFRVTSLALEGPARARAFVSLPRPLAIFSRRRLDRALLARAGAAGAHLVEARVTGVAREGGGGWRLRLADGDDLEADHVVGADGARSAVRREMAAPFEARDLSQAVGWYVPGRSTDVLTIRFDERIDGYLWIFPRSDHLAVGACAPLREGIAEELWRTGRDLLRETLGISDDGLPRYSALIPTLSEPSLDTHRVAGDGWSLVGDAAGTVDPLTREGIRHGIESSDLLVRAFAGGDPDRYPGLWSERFEAGFRWASSRRARFFDPSLTERFVRYVAASRSVRAVLSDLVLGEQDYLTLRRRLVRSVLPVGADLLVARARGIFGASPR